jgi:hypothetical protein
VLSSALDHARSAQAERRIVLAMPDVDATHFLYRYVLRCEVPLWVVEQMTAGLRTLVEAAPGG